MSILLKTYCAIYYAPRVKQSGTLEFCLTWFDARPGMRAKNFATSSFVVGDSLSRTNSVRILDGPVLPAEVRSVQYIGIVNPSVISQNFTISQSLPSRPGRINIISVLLKTKEMLRYKSGSGWTVYDENGSARLISASSEGLAPPREWIIR